MYSIGIPVFILLTGSSTIFAYNANLSLDVLSQCQEYQIDGEYKYREAFEIMDMKNNKPYENEVFRLKFYVFTLSYAHILISNQSSVDIGDPAYEIGAYQDDFLNKTV